MQRSNSLPGVKTFRFYTGKSFAFHLGIILIGMILSYVLNLKTKKTRDYNLKLIESSVRVDVVAMPKMTFQELKAMQEAGGTGEAPAAETDNKPVDNTPDRGNEFIKKKKKLSLSEMLKNISKKKVNTKVKKKAKTPRAEGNGLSGEWKKRLGNLANAGNKINKGSSLVGQRGGTISGPMATYMNSLPNFIRPHWKLPSYLLEKDLRCRLRVFLNARGKLLRVEVFESSGEKDFDNRALQAVKTAKFPVPETSYSSQVSTQGILLGFPL